MAPRPLPAPNQVRHRPGDPGGHYESFFLRANHPDEPRALWIRHTIFSPAGRPQDARGELWAVVFDGQRGRHVAAKTDVPLATCRFQGADLDLQVGGAELRHDRARGSVGAGADRIAWDLRFGGDTAALLLLPPRLYAARLPRAKSLVPRPRLRFDGTLAIGDHAVEVREWIGSQNHNWGSRHTDRYAWGQVVGFDERPDAILEVATAWLRVGPCWTPPLTPLVLRLGAREIRLNALRQSVRARARLERFRWAFDGGDAAVRVVGTIEAAPDAFVGLRYRNPPGGEKHCLNTKIAACRLRLVDGPGGEETTLTSAQRAAFEILTDDRDHGIPIQV